ncbi:hypothetical protein IW139_001675 [Coemansia sp. RSA 353]|nr:hypothetical protein IW142_000750 [Coemansia sp. RSA 564]KAJ2167684.1 hypothetical protein GGH15_001955 [Coemansia sp. RSA 562]KAJ2185612.1 hypothetical protein EV181_003778 [Coemansia sp. RSA 532]KAJ2200389.1 hypothetical protein IW144_001161 [Coemansia sp. RSA 522]KAJ2208085.1 hypothetical protein IW145_001003 [Coemansia sp. RSA 521]KAJ2231094.1 hypothetical protein EV180_000578 [Coemansia sp. RSA 518]KAJ2278532.1 hypothetical protein J3F81_000426 [Coemansia sp. RSA 371]KAJ2299516.1 hyp
MSEYGGSNYDPARSYLHGYGPGNSGKRDLGRSDEKAPAYTAGESASYDNIQNNGDSRTLYESRPQDRPEHRSEHKSEYKTGHKSEYKTGQPQSSFRPRQHDGDRSIADFFYKQPDPTYSGMYGTDYQPQVNKTKVVGAVAGVAALLYGFSQYKKRKDSKKKFEKYTKSHHSHRTKKTSASTIGREDSHDGRSRY